MGSCFSTKETTYSYLKHADKTFNKIDKSKKNQLEFKDLESYFGSYSTTATKMLMREMDFNKDGVITRNQWMGYWQYVRRSGYRISDIERQLQKIDNGQLQLNFPNTKQYESTQPRQTLVQTIIDDMRKSPANLPFLLQK